MAESPRELGSQPTTPRSPRAAVSSSFKGAGLSRFSSSQPQSPRYGASHDCFGTNGRPDPFGRFEFRSQVAKEASAVMQINQSRDHHGVGDREDGSSSSWPACVLKEASAAIQINQSRGHHHVGDREDGSSSSWSARPHDVLLESIDVVRSQLPDWRTSTSLPSSPAGREHHKDMHWPLGKKYLPPIRTKAVMSPLNSLSPEPLSPQSPKRAKELANRDTSLTKHQMDT